MRKGAHNTYVVSEAGSCTREYLPPSEVPTNRFHQGLNRKIIARAATPKNMPMTFGIKMKMSETTTAYAALLLRGGAGNFRAIINGQKG